MIQTLQIIGQRISEIPDRPLSELETIIERGIKTFVEVGRALLEIRERRLYREQGYERFEDYCRERWKMSQPHAQRMIDASKVAENLIPIGIIPRTESQARELTRLTPDRQRSVAGRVDFTIATALEIRDEVRREMHEKFLSPSKARAKAIATGAHTLDWNGIYQPPCTKEREEQIHERRQILRPLVDFLEWSACCPDRLNPLENFLEWKVCSLEQAAGWIDYEWIGNEEDVSVSARRAADWLIQFAELMERNK
jgi:hypothetical protein